MDGCIRTGRRRNTALANPQSPIPNPRLSELDLRRRPHLLLLPGGDLQQRGRGEVEHARDDARGEHLALDVVGHHHVVERLAGEGRTEEQTYEIQSLMRISYAVLCLK